MMDGRRMDDFLYQKITVPGIDGITREMRSMFTEEDLARPRFSVLPIDRTMAALPSLAGYFSSNGLIPKVACLIIIEASTDQVIHVDYLKDEITLAMNFPLCNCEYAYTSFYENNGILTVQYTPRTNLPYYSYFDPDPREIDRFVLDGPTILNIRVPHAVHNPGKSNRVCMSFRFSSDPWGLIT
jgi:hypothetical protein